MKYTQKTKYFVFGSLATAVLAPLAIFAVETIPVTFAEGDVISASVMNNVLKRVNDTQRGFTSSSEIAGTWACTTYSVRNGCDPGFNATAGGVQTAKTQNIVFSCNGNTCTATAATFFPGSCNAGGTLSQNYELNGNVMASGWVLNCIQI